MKCDELKVYVPQGGPQMSTELTTPIKIEIPGIGTIESADLYLKSEVDAAIAELKAKLEDAKATEYAESVDAGMRERRLKRALYKACANWAHSEYLWASFVDFKYPENWVEMERKCRAKAKEYK